MRLFKKEYNPDGQDNRDCLERNNINKIRPSLYVISIISVFCTLLLLFSSICLPTLTSKYTLFCALAIFLVFSILVCLATPFLPKIMLKKYSQRVNIASIVVGFVFVGVMVGAAIYPLQYRVAEKLSWGDAYSSVFYGVYQLNNQILNQLFDFFTANYQLFVVSFCIIMGLFSVFIITAIIRVFIVQVHLNFCETRTEYFRRFALVVCPVILLTYLYIIYSPFELFFGNIADMGIIILPDFVFPLLFLFIGVVVLFSFIVSLFSGKFFDIVVCLLFGVAIASYVQLLFFNGFVGELNGTINSNLSNPVLLIVNILIWVIIIVAVFFVYHSFNKVMKGVIKYGSLAITLILIVATVSLVLAAPAMAFERGDSQYLSSGNQFTVSPNDNIIVFVVDQDSNEYFDAVFYNAEKWKSVFSDFTYYNNSDSIYMGTNPSVNHILTGYPYYPNETTLSQYYADSWLSNNTRYFYDKLIEHNYSANIYTDSGLVGGVNVISNVISNVVSTDGEILHVDISGLLGKFLSVSLYRNLPNVYKLLQYNSVQFSFTDIVFYENSATCLENYDYYSQLKSIGLSKDLGSENKFSFHHIVGVHPPHFTTALCEYSNELTSQNETQEGCLILLEEYFKQLKDLGVYDNSTIIILADHGNFASSSTDQQSLFLIKEPNVHHESCVINSAPITHREIIPTILTLLDEAYPEEDMLSIYEISEDSNRERLHYDRVDDMYYYVYKYIGDRQSLFEKIKNAEYSVMPIQG